MIIAVFHNACSIVSVSPIGSLKAWLSCNVIVYILTNLTSEHQKSPNCTPEGAFGRAQNRALKSRIGELRYIGNIKKAITVFNLQVKLDTSSQ